MSAPKMTKSGRKVNPPRGYTDADLSDDSQYASYKDDSQSLSQMETTEDEQEIAPQLESFNGRQHRNNNNCVAYLRTQSFGKRMPIPDEQHAGRSVSSTASLTDKKQHIQRMPTRRPNPKIFNRNALMARENRIKKKQHLETLEHDVHTLKQENDSLRKLLKKRSSMVYKLRDERLYLKSIIANKTSIMSLLKTIQGNRIPITSSAMSFVTEHDDNQNETTGQNSSASSSPATTTSSGYLNDELDGTVTCLNADPMMSAALTPLSSSTDLQYKIAERGSPTHSLSSECSSASSTSVCAEMPLDTWESLLTDDEFRADSYYIPQLLSDVDDADEQLLDAEPATNDTASNDCQSNVSHEHNYFNNHIIKQSAEPSSKRTGAEKPSAAPAAKRPQSVPSLVDQPGICLHLSGGRVSLEFCGSCHRHSMDAWDEEL